MKHKNRNM